MAVRQFRARTGVIGLDLGSASDFEWRCRGLLRAFVFGCALASYSIDHDDVVWAISPWHTPHKQMLARCMFAGSAMLLCLAQTLRSWARAYETANCNYEFDSGAATWRAGGPFQYVRNPMALGDGIFVVGISSLLSCTGAVIAIVGTAILVIRATNRRECELQRVAGCGYRTLCDRVPMVVPSMVARIPSRSVPPRWKHAFRSESPGWCCCLMVIAFSITFRDSIAWIIGGSALALALILNSTTLLAESFRDKTTSSRQEHVVLQVSPNDCEQKQIE